MRFATRSDGSPEGWLVAVGLEPPMPHAQIRQLIRFGIFGYAPDPDAVEITSPDVPVETP